jgi:FtsH-binding integral membrane protein
MKTKKMYLVLALMLFATATFAQPRNNPNFGQWAQQFWQQSIAPLWPWIIAIVFLVTAFFNIGDINGPEKNYKKFFSAIGLYVGGVAAVMIVITWLTSQTI